MRSLFALLLIALLSLPASARAQDEVRVRIVDVGPGLCTVTRIPGDSYMIYDAGHWVGGNCIEAVRELVEGEIIHLMVISHSDSDHLGDAAAILEEYTVNHIVTTGYQRWDSGSWRAMNEAIGEEAKYGATVRNLGTAPLRPGEQIQLGDATVTFVAGWNEWREAGPTAAERRNAISIVVRLDYDGRSVLYAGDTVGKRLGDPDSACKDAEKVMADNHDAGIVSIDADVLIAPHHGGNNGSSRCFIERVTPEVVIFSAGHRHQHPSSAAAGRYLAAGIPVSKLFRTDRGDDEHGTFEWKTGSISGCSDGRGDDDVEVVIPRGQPIRVGYVRPGSGC
jgi:beta-lactamase superfamily II metal-dependent hydrolase